MFTKNDSIVIQFRRANGFTLLEMIGVLAVMAILAGALAPNLIQLLDEGYESAERQSLATIADSLERSIRANKIIPSASATEWPARVAEYSAISAGRVLENERGFSRRLYVDPRFWTNTDQTFSTYQQTQGASSPPVAPRMMLVSRLDGNVGQALNSHTAFQDVWEQTPSASIVEGKKLLIQRIHLGPLFHRVILSNSSAQQAGFQLENSTEAAVASAVGGSDGIRTLYAIADTRLTVRAAPYPGGAIESQMIINGDTSLRYELSGATWMWTK